MGNLQKIKVNDIIYECFTVDYSNGFTAVLKTEDLTEVENNFKKGAVITVMSRLGLVEKNLSGYNQVEMISKIPDYYMGADNTMHSAISIKMKPLDIALELESLKDKIDDTVNEADMTLDEYKAYRVEQSKVMLKDYLETHPITSTAHGGVEGIYTITEEKQNEMMRNYFSYQIEKQAGLSPKLTWNETGKSCTEWEEEEYLLLSAQIRARAISLVSYQQQMEERINGLFDKGEIAKLVIDYDSVPLPSVEHEP